MFSSAGQKAVKVSPLRVGGDDVVSVEFGGFSNTTKNVDDSSERDEELGGDLRVMGIDVRNQKVDDIDGYAVAIVLSDSTLNVTLLKRALLTTVVLVQFYNGGLHPHCRGEIHNMLPLRMQIHPRA